MADEIITLDLPDNELLQLFMMAHERDITFNQLVIEILTEEMKKLNKKITVAELENSETFDRVFDDIEKNGTTYTIYEGDKEIAVLLPYEEKYNA